MSFWGYPSQHGGVPRDSPDLAFLMSFVTSVGGVAAWSMRNSKPGLLSGVAVGSLFLTGGLQIMDNSILSSGNVAGTKVVHSHETGHQMCLIGSLMFARAMGYRVGSNPYSGPGGAMLAALGAVSGTYHLDKMLEWRRWEENRVAQAERLLRQHQQLPEGEVERRNTS